MKMPNHPLRWLLCGFLAYVVAYIPFRSYAAQYAPFAWGRLFPVCNLGGPVFPSNDAWKWDIPREAAYYFFSPLVEIDLAFQDAFEPPFESLEPDQVPLPP